MTIGRRAHPTRLFSLPQSDDWPSRVEGRGEPPDVIWTGFCGEQAPEKIRQVFDIVTRARDAAFEAVDRAMREGRRLEGWQVDDGALREVI